MLKELADRLREGIDEFKEGKRKISKDGMLILLLCGILVYIIFLPNSESGDIFGGKGLTYNDVLEENKDYYDEKERMERELESFLSNIDGVGAVKVLIYLENEEKTAFSSNSYSKIAGVVIGAHGAESDQVRGQIIHLVMVLYGLRIDQVEVFSLKK